MMQKVAFAPSEKAVFILGAGFSKAISEHMPLTDELGRSVIAALTVGEKTNFSVPISIKEELSFEVWLSWLAERQPYESEIDFHTHLAEFAMLQEKIASVVRHQQALAELETFPSWVFELIDFIHHGEATVVTLNYDTLFESAFSRMHLTDRSGERSQRWDLTKVFPTTNGVTYNGLAGVARANGTADLFKLHGSTDWFWSEGDRSGATLEVITRSSELDRTDLNKVELKTLRASIGGKSEFIVPPTSLKNPYFENPKTRYMWRESFEALAHADTVTLIGYSLPINDSAFTSMLSRSLKKSSGKVIVVNPNGSDIKMRLESLGIQSHRITVVDGLDCVERFVQGLKRDANRWFVKELRKYFGGHEGAPLAVGWGGGQISAVIGANFDSEIGLLTLDASPLALISNLRRPGISMGAEPSVEALTLDQILADGMKFDDVERIEVSIPDYGSWVLGGWVTDLPNIQRDEVSHGSNDWLVLRPIGQIPSAY